VDQVIENIPHHIETTLLCWLWPTSYKGCFPSCGFANEIEDRGYEFCKPLNTPVRATKSKYMNGDVLQLTYF